MMQSFAAEKTIPFLACASHALSPFPIGSPVALASNRIRFITLSSACSSAFLSNFSNPADNSAATLSLFGFFLITTHEREIHNYLGEAVNTE